MKVALFTREYPPEVYGGAGVHVEYLARELRAFEDVTVHGWGVGDVPHTAWDALSGDAPALAALRSLSIDLTMAAGAQDADIVHTHTWYAQYGGHLAKLVWGIPHVATVHSLEPLRPWKEEQLGGGYRLSSYAEKTALEHADAVIAVSNGTKGDILRVYPDIDPDRVHVIYNGIDTDEYQPDPNTDVLEKYGIDPAKPSVVFVGRITRQKGVVYLLEAVKQFAPDAQLVLCAGSPDTPELGAEIAARVEDAEGHARGRVLDRGDDPQARGHPAAQPRDGVRVPVDLRAARDRQPGGDGVRGRGRGHRDGRDRRSRRRRRDRLPRPDRAGRRRHGRARAIRPSSPPTSRRA